ncbi:uncharacterized protein FSUBG_6352 [Fusarium subglutinans]|uniref:Uncharacterized protein n=1 Tax=Gibberella subglutinans TaxID=42677 RepID=A0A8H5V2D0_GIBSU|nr:uncharacterized protein FSUBG_6352 [Fusarium subglutinans]KAF5605749.1 hypothetical protein FSUBG_6352 [Fusarium subglutinans]
MLCPLREKKIVAESDELYLTNEFVTRLEHSILERPALGLGLLGLCTTVELLIATHVFNIYLKCTLTFSCLLQILLINPKAPPPRPPPRPKTLSSSSSTTTTMILICFIRKLLLRDHPPQAPTPQRGISYIEAINLTAFFVDIAQMTHQVKEGLDIPYTLDHWKAFWNMVFQDWDTSVGNADDLPLRAVTLADSKVRAGKLTMNHPPSVEYPGPPGPARLQGQPVYMSISPAAQDQLLQPIWKGEAGKFVSPRYIEMEMPRGECLDLAVLRFDRATTSRMKDYNLACITNAARHRLMHFAVVGTGVAANVPVNCRAPTPLVPELDGDRAEETAIA